jgi:hypothetical protein
VASFHDWTGLGSRVKFPWFANDIGDDEMAVARLSIEGKRMDGNALRLIVEGPNVGILPDYRFFASVLVFPSAGCWQIWAKRKDTVLNFTVWIP